MRLRRRVVRAVCTLTSTALLMGSAALNTSAPAAADTGGPTESFTFSPEADAYVDAAQPSVSFGTSNYLWVDASSVKQSFIRFQLTGMTGRTINDVRLRLYQTDESPLGGTVWSMSSDEWDETVTWDTRPAIDGAPQGSFGPVESLTWYELSLDPAVVDGDGPLSLAIDSTNSDGARWASREHLSPPELIVEVEPVVTDSFSFTPVADAYVDAAQPGTSFGTLPSMWVDASPVKQSFLRFDVSGIATRTVVAAHLRLYQTDASLMGGRVFGMTDDDWDESVTWDTRPAIDGALLGSFREVSNGTWYEAALEPSPIAGDGPVSLALDSTSSDGARWGSRQHVELPQLIVEVARIPGFVQDGLSQVSAPYLGSSDPTYYASSHRLAVSAGGRQLAVHGRHGQGVQLLWRDPGGGWMMMSRGEVRNGLLLGGTGTGDWVASVGVGTDSVGEEHAWVVWTGATAASTKIVELRRLSELDAPDGPLVGPRVIVSSTAQGNSKVDLSFETTLDRGLRGCIGWLKRVGASSWNQTVIWFTDLDTDTPTFHDPTVLFSTNSGGGGGTLVPVLSGTRLVVRGPTGRLQVFAHDVAAPLTTWTAGARGVAVGTASIPGGDALSTGEVLVAIESNTTNHVVTVQRFSAKGATATADVQATGYREPSITTDGLDAWLVMIRQSDGFVVSRRFTDASGWESIDREEIGNEGGGNYQWPNLLRGSEGRLRMVVRGPSGGSNMTAVLALDRPE